MQFGQPCPRLALRSSFLIGGLNFFSHPKLSYWDYRLLSARLYCNFYIKKRNSKKNFFSELVFENFLLRKRGKKTLKQYFGDLVGLSQIWFSNYKKKKVEKKFVSLLKSNTGRSNFAVISLIYLYSIAAKIQGNECWRRIKILKMTISSPFGICNFFHLRVNGITIYMKNVLSMTNIFFKLLQFFR